MDYNEALKIAKLPMMDNDAEAKTVGDYLRELLLGVWVQGEGFSGKRPFGNSGWQRDIYKALVKGNAIKGSFEEEGFYLAEFDEEAADELVSDLINALFLSVSES